MSTEGEKVVECEKKEVPVETVPEKKEEETVPKTHKLQSAWSFWYDKKLPRGQQVVNYTENLKRIGTFDTVEDFWRYYIHMKRPSALDKDCNYYLFRDQLVPAWETFPNGGCWILKVKRTSGVLGKLWQDLVFAAIGEAFEDPNVVGVMMARRTKEDMISVWNSANTSFSTIGDKLREILGLDPTTIVEYKLHKQSLVDGSTFRNAQAYVFAAKPEETPAEEKKEAE
ncbi:hypothetical protein WA538_001100 [Blastocystis sp. DL]